MDDALLVGGGEAASDLLRIINGLAGGERAVAQAVAERLAF
jgi:precorrin-6B methylase 2